MEDLNVILSHDNVVSQKQLKEDFNFYTYQNLSSSEISDPIQSNYYSEQKIASFNKKPKLNTHSQDAIFPDLQHSAHKDTHQNHAELIDLHESSQEHASKVFDSFKNQQTLKTIEELSSKS